MPLCADPHATIPYVLKLDRDKPTGQQPTFHFRFLTFQEDRKLEAILAQAQSATGEDEVRLANAAAHMTLCGWSNVTFRGEKIDYEPGRDVTAFLTAQEVWEIANAARREPLVTERDRKNSASPAPSAPASSAAGAAPPAA